MKYLNRRLLKSQCSHHTLREADSISNFSSRKSSGAKVPVEAVHFHSNRKSDLQPEEVDSTQQTPREIKIEMLPTSSLYQSAKVLNFSGALTDSTGVRNQRASTDTAATKHIGNISESRDNPSKFDNETSNQATMNQA